MTFYGICEACNNPVQDPETPAFPVTGWEVLRAGGGANAIRERQRIPNRVRHAVDDCLKKKPGEGQQESLL